jgi:hypothetical protein
MAKNSLNKEINQVRTNITSKKKTLSNLLKFKLKKSSLVNHKSHIKRRKPRRVRRPKKSRSDILNTYNVPKRKTKTADNNSKDVCKIITAHNEIIVFPSKYPGDMWVHNYLEKEHHKPIEYFSGEYLKSIYNKYRRICYGY